MEENVSVDCYGAELDDEDPEVVEPEPFAFIVDGYPALWFASQSNCSKTMR